MAHANHPDIAKLVWTGRHEEALAEARRIYELDPKKYLIMYASTAYSARLKIDVSEIIAEISDALIADVDSQESPDALDVISTILFWWHTHYDSSPMSSIRSMIAALKASEKGLNLLANSPINGHSVPLLLLTRAAIELRSGGKEGREQGMQDLVDAEFRAGFVADKNQRARAYRKLGVMYLQRLKPFKGVWYLLKARSVPGIAPDVQAKNPI